MTINADSSENIEIYEGEFTSFDGFEGQNQFNLDGLVNNLPEELRKSVENNVIFVNGCHSYAATILGRCPLVCGIQPEHLLMAQQIQIGNYPSGSLIKHLLTIELTIHCFMKHHMPFLI